MSLKNKGRAGWHQATSNSCKFKTNFTAIVAYIKATIVTLALWGWLPLTLARWANRIGGKNDE